MSKCLRLKNMNSKSNKIFSSQDALQVAKQRLPRLIFDFIEGATGREVSALRNMTRFDEITLQPRVMEDVETRRLNTNLLGQSYDLPFGIAPMGMCNIAWPGADKALAEAAQAFNLPVCLSSAASSSIEDMRSWAGENSWFQLYVGSSMEKSLALVDRARNAG